MEAVIGKLPVVYIILTLLFSLCAWLSGSLRAQNWQSVTGTAGYAVLIALGHRFLCYALSGAKLLGIEGFLVSALLFIAISGLAYRIYQVRGMVQQYPWLYESAGWFNWRERRE